jgi:hypothetical protein
MNVRPSSFAQAGSSDRFMIFMLPFMTLLFRALVIRQRIVELTTTDQKQLFTSSLCNFLIAVVLSAFFEKVGEARQENPSFHSEITPQCIVFALLVAQIVTQTTIRRRSTEASIYDNVNWLWSPATLQAALNCSTREHTDRRSESRMPRLTYLLHI